MSQPHTLKLNMHAYMVQMYGLNLTARGIESPHNKMGSDQFLPDYLGFKYIFLAVSSDAKVLRLLSLIHEHTDRCIADCTPFQVHVLYIPK